MAADARLIAIVGPTASGKSALGLRLARERFGEIVGCDSMQVYRGLDVGTAKPTVEERGQVPHHLIDVVRPDQPFSAADYARLARAAVADIHGRGRLPIVVGGTGLYLRALLFGLFEGPSRDEAFRRRLERIAAKGGDARLHRLLARADPEAASRIAVRDRVRVVRALEVWWATGRPITAHHRRPPEPLRGFTTFVVGLAPERAALRAAVERRTRDMLERGLLEETQALVEAGSSPELPALRAIGYRQALAALRGAATLEDTQRDIVTETMRYAKRQMTWFRHQAAVFWCRDAEEARTRVLEWLDLTEGA